MKPERNLFKFLSIIFVVLFLSGCATALKEKPSGFPYSTVYINGRTYFALIEMCEAEGWGWDYDPLSKIVILKKKDRSLKMLIGGLRVLVDGVARDLSDPVTLEGGIIYAPLEVYQRLQDALKLQREKIEPSHRYI